MRSRWLLAVLALVGGLLSTTPASANVGSYCGGWRATVTGGHQMACYVRSANYEIAARGRAYYDGGERLDQLNISVTLQRSSNGTSWTNVVSRVCGFTDVPSEMPGASCLTTARYVDAGMLYRARTFLVLFETNGTIRTTAPSFSPVTS